MKKYFLLSILCLTFNNIPIFSQASAGSKARYESRYVIDMPNAGVLPKEDYSVKSLVQPNGIVLFDFSYSLFTNFNLGVSYSSNNLIGTGDIVFQKYPSLNVKFRFLDETLFMPAFTFGFSNQGTGEYIKSLNRFQTLSPGLFLASSKNFKWYLGFISTHAGINYSFDNGSNSNSPNIYLGIEQSLGSNLALLGEINFNLNESTRSISNGALLNSSIRWSVNSNVTVEIQIKDLMRNQTFTKDNTRAFGFEYIGKF